MHAVSESVPTAHSGAAPAGNGGPPELAADAAARLDGFVDRARPPRTSSGGWIRTRSTASSGRWSSRA